MPRLLKVVTSFACKVGKELLNENNADELGATRKRKERRQRSAESLRTSEFVRGVDGMIDKNHGKSMHNILPKILKCLKEE
ncbi:unnamed protein product [Hymenolepis diminuta]|uniref:Uncharacterized protein n=1 Tax=Hymenolepis diminuta TaxID=6216 RepID=A0A0R3SJT6_HYMDI|nr:unnamed protein product [Hymenolepis diminuta]